MLEGSVAVARADLAAAAVTAEALRAYAENDDLPAILKEARRLADQAKRAANSALHLAVAAEARALGRTPPDYARPVAPKAPAPRRRVTP